MDRNHVEVRSWQWIETPKCCRLRVVEGSLVLGFSVGGWEEISVNVVSELAILPGGGGWWLYLSL
jgi:hypothetical protein